MDEPLTMDADAYEDRLQSMPEPLRHNLLQGDWLAAPVYLQRAATVEARIRAMPGAVTGQQADELCPLSHSFADGLYIREMRCPAGVLAVTKLHKTKHPFFVMEGEVSVLTMHGVERIKAPFHGITPAGTKRVVFTHTDTVWITVHATDETDLEKIEEHVIAKDFSELQLSDEEMAQLMETS